MFGCVRHNERRRAKVDGPGRIDPERFDLPAVNKKLGSLAKRFAPRPSRSAEAAVRGGPLLSKELAGPSNWPRFVPDLRPMRLLFDHGTLVLAEAPDLSLDFVPGLLWDDRVALFRAPAWRYTDVVDALSARKLPVRDEVRPSTPPLAAAWRTVDLRPYQQAAALSWELARRRGIVVLPTGSGKTRVALATMASTRARTLCLVPTRVLLEQWLGEIRAFYAGPVGCLGDGERRLEAVTVATFESAYRHMPRIGRDFELLIVDEVHHFGVGVRDEALEMSIAPFRLGLTATPPDEAALGRLDQLLGPVVYRLGVGDLAGTWLADFDLAVLQLGLNEEERARYNADYRLFSEVNRRFRRLHPQGTWQEFVFAASQSPEGRAALSAWRRSRRLTAFTRAKADAVPRLLDRHADARVLIFTADNESACSISRDNLVMPMTCEISRPERARAIEAFRRGEIRALVSARVLNEGIDVPDADVAIIVAGTHGEREHVQRVGRLLRPAPGKRAVVYELVTMATGEARRARERRRGLAATGAAVA
jgi:superfamily II DNA or RNA helicase